MSAGESCPESVLAPVKGHPPGPTPPFLQISTNVRKSMFSLKKGREGKKGISSLLKNYNCVLQKSVSVD